MTQFAEHVYTAQHDIARIESWAGQLEDEARVEILLADGARVEGFVAARPPIQVFRDGEGREGMNALVRIDDQAHPEPSHYPWPERLIARRRSGTAGERLPGSPPPQHRPAQPSRVGLEAPCTTR